MNISVDRQFRIDLGYCDKGDLYIVIDLEQECAVFWSTSQFECVLWIMVNR